MDLSIWAVKNRITHTALKELLLVLKANGHSELPQDPRTLLGTPRTADISAMDAGEFCHFDLKNIIAEQVKRFKIKSTLLELTINVDGLPIFKSTSYSLWLLLGYIDGTNCSPFVISIYGGVTKPQSANNFMRAFVDEFKQLQISGVTVD